MRRVFGLYVPVVYFLGMIVLAVTLGGCAGLRTDRDIAASRANAYVESHPDLDTETAAAIRGLRAKRGMTMEQVIAAWGYPADVKRYRNGAVQHWFFGCYWPHLCYTVDESIWFPEPEDLYESQVLFENGRAVHVQG